MSIVSNQVYQAVVQELEEVLSPRVVSRSLKEGLIQLGRSSGEIDVDGLETILKSQIYRQLQVTMPVVQAKDAISKIVERLHAVAVADPAPQPPAAQGEPEPDRLTPALEQQALTIERLQESLKPYNLYFEWAEVQKLRAQIQLLEQEQEQGNDVSAVIAEADVQLDIVSRMLEDHLVIQARELGELQEALEQVHTLGGPKVRRLENLLGQIAEEQGQRQLAPAEVERARKLARDLRKLMESSVYSEGAAPQDADGGGVLEVASDEDGLLTIDSIDLDPEVSARLLLLDLEAEREDLDALEAEHANLLSFEDDLAARFTGLRAQLDNDNSITEPLADLANSLGGIIALRREALITEIEVMEAQRVDLPDGVDIAELRQTIQVAKGVLSTTLPKLSDIQHIRNLHRLAFEQSGELARLERESEEQRLSQLREQTELLARLEATLLRYQEQEGGSEEFAGLTRKLDALRAATEEERSVADLVVEVRRTEEEFEAAVAERSDDDSVRERSRIRALIGRVERMPTIEVMAEHIQSTTDELERQLDNLENDRLGASQLEGLDALVANLEAEVKAACQQRLEELAPTVADLGGELLSELKGASDMLDDGEYPDLLQLEQHIALQREARRSAQMDDLHALEREATLYETIDTEANDRLKLLLADIRTTVDDGRLTQDLVQGWRLLEHVKEIVDRRLADFEPRLDAALEAFDAVAMLNSEDVAKARRTLAHLDSQRASMARVSISLRTKLENALQEAETLIAQLQEEFEATRAIADQLVSANVLDDVLNIFGDGDPTVSDPVAGDPAGAVEGDPILALLNELAAERGVRGAVALRDSGAVATAELSIDMAVLSGALGSLAARLGDLGQALELGAPQQITLESESQVMIAAWPLPNEGLVVVLDDPSVLSLVLHRLRVEEERLRYLLRAP